MRTLTLLLTLTLAPGTLAAAAPAPADVHLGGPAFSALAADSYRRATLDGTFSAWLSAAYTRTGKPLAGGQTLSAALDARRAQVQAASGAERDKLALDTAAWAHAFVKAAVPRFSLERGYEFASIPKYGERQCLLQSTIIAALLQRAGLNAGLVMVWKSLSGQESNLGHVTSVVRLSTGDVQVDASEPTPTAKHQGLLAWVDGGWRFVTPTFDGDVMTTYVRTDGRGSVPAAKLGFLSLAYIRSQYDYYRAERTVGGVLGTGSGRSTPDGLKTSEALLRQSLQEEPGNPLAASVLGTVLRKQGRDDDARAQYRKAAALYTAAGHMPAGMTANLAWANGTGHLHLPSVLATLFARR
ncbi:hypothetical protein HNQ07_002529 [Deinococcus metalli]|uniref:Tetratricopeptide repeat protein n=1 Tax=Deinococcus metalli TaxID=1141878 RepID=A0A7W8KHF0_9DEIO|nr:hypothetical protein [Deinococcus metalli]MBB5377056.1 hypothetical protein [Deinococcus metalli]GHF49269.1 hypothetical protein GCM10017781_27190 [Deinococcus metalli]